MGAHEEAIVREFMDAWGDGTQEIPDVEKIMSMFAEDAEWQLWIPGGPMLRGKVAIRRDIERQVTWARFMRCGTIHLASVNGVVFTERLDQFVSNGVTVNHALVAIFEVDTDGKISKWREYFDTKDVERQLAAAAVTVPRVAKDPV